MLVSKLVVSAKPQKLVCMTHHWKSRTVLSMAATATSNQDVVWTAASVYHHSGFCCLSFCVPLSVPESCVWLAILSDLPLPYLPGWPDSKSLAFQLPCWLSPLACGWVKQIINISLLWLKWSFGWLLFNSQSFVFPPSLMVSFQDGTWVYGRRTDITLCAKKKGVWSSCDALWVLADHLLWRSLVWF